MKQYLRLRGRLCPFRKKIFDNRRFLHSGRNDGSSEVMMKSRRLPSARGRTSCRKLLAMKTGYSALKLSAFSFAPLKGLPLLKRTTYHLKLKRLSALGFMLSTFLFCVCLVHAGQRGLTNPAATGVASSTDSIKPLQIGDTIPEVLWNLPMQMVKAGQEGSATVTLKDYKGKLIILDFWATWCSACIAAMPKANRLQQKFSQKLALLPISGEPNEKVARFLVSNRTLKEVPFASIVADRLVRAYFPHGIIPHVVWIDSAGVYRAATTVGKVTAHEIRQMLLTTASPISNKIDIDARRPLFLVPSFPLQHLQYYSLLTKGRYGGLPSGSRLRKADNTIYGRVFTNTALATIYRTIARQLFKENGEDFSERRMLLEWSRPDTVLWNYEFTIPLNDARHLYKWMLENLNRYSGYDGQIEYRKVDCLVLHANHGVDKLKTKGGIQENTLFYKPLGRMVNCSIGALLTKLNGLEGIDLPIVDGTGLKGNIDIALPAFTDMAELNKELKKNGLELKQERRTLAMFVLHDKLHTKTFTKNK